jgi:hypothetical protein
VWACLLAAASGGVLGAVNRAALSQSGLVGSVLVGTATVVFVVIAIAGHIAARGMGTDRSACRRQLDRCFRHTARVVAPPPVVTVIGATLPLLSL